MKTLYERLLDTEDNLVTGVDEEMIKAMLGQIYDTKEIKKIEVKSNGIYITGNLIVNFSYRDIKTLSIPDINIKYVSGDFSCAYCFNIKTLEGSPEEVGRMFNCSGCKGLTSLEGAPEEVRGIFTCTICDNLESLKGAPKKIGRKLYCKRCPNLTDYANVPENKIVK